LHEGKRQNQIFWFKQKKFCNSIADQNLISFAKAEVVQNLVKKFCRANDANSNLFNKTKIDIDSNTYT
jgi:hypothetical protein